MRSLPTESDEEESSALFAEFLSSPHSSESVGRLQMANDFLHTPVMLDRVVELFADVPTGVIVDATLGGAGHARELLMAYPQQRVLGIDRDDTARRAAVEVLEPFAERSRVAAGTFGELAAALEANGDFIGALPVVGVLFDLGVSSPQLDDPSRGFSFRADAPLDMRMDSSQGVTAAQLIDLLSESDLVALLRRHGESRFAGAIARSLKQRHPHTTAELVDAVERAVPPVARRRGNVATRVFQALRVEVNDEEGQLEAGLRAAMATLAVGGVIVVISYHSGEDRAVKTYLHNEETGGCVCPPELGCVCGAVRRVRLLKSSAVLADDLEIALNSRSRSARLRAAWKVAP